MILRLGVYLFKIVCAFSSPARFPSYKGFSLRGAFGSAFRRVCCIKGLKDDCSLCMLRSHCAYFRIFESQQLTNSEGKDLPRGFVLEPPYDRKREYKEGDEIEFNVILFGWVKEYLPFFLLAFESMGKRKIGLPGERGEFKIKDVIFKGERIYNDGQLQEIDITPLEIDYPSIPFNAVEIEIISPLRLKHNSSMVSADGFNETTFITSVARRIRILDKHYNILQDNIKWDSLMDLLVLEEKHVKWIDKERFSTRQQQRMKLGGLIGSAKFRLLGTEEGKQKLFEVLKACEFIHIGKATTFGLGKILVKGEV